VIANVRTTLVGKQRRESAATRSAGPREEARDGIAEGCGAGAVEGVGDFTDARVGDGRAARSSGDPRHERVHAPTNDPDFPS
jgi:hypothetical protein